MTNEETNETKGKKKPEQAAAAQQVDNDWKRLGAQPWLHGDNQIVKGLDEQHLVIGFFDPYQEKLNGQETKGATIVLTKDNALDLAEAIIKLTKEE